MKPKFALLFLLCSAILWGCGRKTPAPTNPETIPDAAAVTAEAPQPTEPEPSFDYKPTQMGAYILASPDIEAGPEVLDSITMTLSDKEAELTRRPVSNRQFDLIKDGRQIGGILLVELPREKLEEAASSEEAFLELADLLGKQTMPDIYPSRLFVSGGGHVVYPYLENVNCNPYLTMLYSDLDILYETYEASHRLPPSCVTCYVHTLYIGENYIYDFWKDNLWMADGGETIQKTLSAEDIHQELNETAFTWSYGDTPWGQCLRDQQILALIKELENP